MRQEWQHLFSRIAQQKPSHPDCCALRVLLGRNYNARPSHPLIGSRGSSLIGGGRHGQRARNVEQSSIVGSRRGIALRTVHKSLAPIIRISE